LTAGSVSILREVLDRGDVLDARVVDDDVHAAGERRRVERPVGEVDAHGRAAEGLRHLSRTAFIQVGHGDGRSRGGEGGRAGGADTARATGDEDLAPVQLS
jgi:hypothetical protein